MREPPDGGGGRDLHRQGTAAKSQQNALFLGVAGGNARAGDSLKNAGENALLQKSVGFVRPNP
jgi:hypothetical protein